MKVFSWVLLFVLSGCGFQKLAVKQADNLLEMETSSKLALYHSQKKPLEKDVTVFLEAQKTHLPRIKKFVDSIDPLKPQDFPKQWEQITKEYRRIAYAYSTILAKNLVTLDVAQRKQFYARSQKDNGEQMKKSKKQDVDHYIPRISYFFGEVTAHQRSVIKRYLPELKRRSKERIDRRQRLQKRIMHILNDPMVAPQKERWLLQAFEDYQLESTENQAPIISMVQELCRELTPAQVKSFEAKREEIHELIALFQETKY